MSEELTSQQAVAEAKRCLCCANPSCCIGCPIDNDIPAFLKALSQANMGDAFAALTKTNALPAICGHLCAHEKQCEAKCLLSKDGNPINVSALERFIAQFAYDHKLPVRGAHDGKAGKVAIIGSGPTGLTVAGTLAKKNFDITIFEGQKEPGGVLLYGIPEFRLHKEIVHQEINALVNSGVKVVSNTLIGKDITLENLFQQGYQAIFIGTGSALPKTLDIPGKDLPGILAATYFLRMVVLSDTGKLNKSETILNSTDEVVIIGAGNVAIDAARTAARRGAKLVTVVYHKSPADMTCHADEYTLAVKEGVQFRFLLQPTAYLNAKQMRALGVKSKPKFDGDGNQLAGVMLQKIIKDENGEFRKGTGQEIISCSSVVLAIGQRPAAQIFTGTKGIEIDAQGFVVTDKKPYGMTTKPGIFSGGDVVNGPSTVVLAIEDAQKVAGGIEEYVKNL